MNDKRTQLIEAAIDLFAKEGFWNTPTSRIAKHAGVATGTLFNYFESKDALIDAVYLQLKQEWTTHLQESIPMDEGFQTAAEHIWFRFIEWGMQNPTRYQLMLQLKLSNLVSQEAHQQQMEGMAFGCPAIGTTAGAAGEIIKNGRNGYLIDVGETAVLAQHLQNLMANRPLLTQLSLAAYTTNQQHPSWDESMAKITQFLEATLAKS